MRNKIYIIHPEYPVDPVNKNWRRTNRNRLNGCISHHLCISWKNDDRLLASEGD
jgi:hypothetical protein